MSFNVGDGVGPYKIIEQHGQGGMATVYKAYHASLDLALAFWSTDMPGLSYDALLKVINLAPLPRKL